MGSSYVINARFVTQSLTGIQRYCYELSSRLSGTLLSPGPPLAHYSDIHSRVVVAGSCLRGHPWEQVYLPFTTKRAQPLFSPAGCGPVFHPNQTVTIHDLAPLENPECYSRGFALWYSNLLPTLSRRASRILTVSNFCKKRIMELLGVGEERITVTWEAASRVFGVRPQGAVDRVRARHGIHRPYFMFVGAFSGRKNLGRLLRAWRGIAGQLDAVLVLIGKSGLRFSDGSELGELPPQVLHLSSVEDDELATLYTGAHGLLYPSLYEGFGLPMLEAMACGCPVLAAACTAMPEVAGDAAVWVDPLSESSIADGILQLSSSSKRAELREKGFLRNQLFSWDTTAAMAESAILA